VEHIHHFLWRAHRHTPGRGDVAIFNRSHYEDVLVTRVHELIDTATWAARYKRVREFETGLTENGTILKFFLQISKGEQLAPSGWTITSGTGRSANPTIPSERALWDDYIEAFEDAICATSTHKRHGMSSRPTTSGFAIWRYRRLWRTRWKR